MGNKDELLFADITEERYFMILNLISDTCFTTTHNS